MSDRCRGFSLLEVIVALAVLTLGISSALALFTAATAAHKRAVDRVNAAAIAEHVVAEVESALARGVTAESLATNPPVAAIERNWPGYEVVLAFVPVAGESEGDLVLLEVRVRWRSEAQGREETFRQLLAKEAVVRALGE